MRSSGEQNSSGPVDKARPPLVASLVGAVPVTLLPGGVEVDVEEPTLPLVLPIAAAPTEERREEGAPPAPTRR
jgi:hypothetical protein